MSDMGVFDRVPCPTCKAAVREECKTPNGVPTLAPHRPRVRLYERTFPSHHPYVPLQAQGNAIVRRLGTTATVVATADSPLWAEQLVAAHNRWLDEVTP